MKGMIPALILSLTCALAAPAADQQFDAFWAKFKQALKAGDKATVACLTKLPYLMEDKPLDKAAFINRFNTIFPSKVRACLQRGKPSRDRDIYEVFCGEEIYIFEKVKGQWLFTEIGAND